VTGDLDIEPTLAQRLRDYGEALDGIESPVVIPTRERHRQRKPAWRVAAAAAAVIGISTGAALLLNERRVDVATRPAMTWSSLASSPLGARRSSASLWTGTEWIVWGGLSDLSDDAIGLRDGAAYEPQSDTWRSIPDAPFAGWDPVAARWIGDEAVFVVNWLLGDTAGYRTVAFAPSSDTWSVLPPSSEYMFGAALTDDSVFWLRLDADKGVLIEQELRTGNERRRQLPRGPAWDIQQGFRGLATRDGVVFVGRTTATCCSPGPAAMALIVRDDSLVLVLVPDEIRDLERFGIYGDAVATATSVLFVGEVNEDGMLRRVAYSLDPATATWSPVVAPSQGLFSEHHTSGSSTLLAAAGEHAVVLGGLDLGDGSIGGLDDYVAASVADRDLTEWFDLPVAPINLDRVAFISAWTGNELLIWGGETSDTGPNNVTDRILTDGARLRINSPQS